MQRIYERAINNEMYQFIKIYDVAWRIHDTEQIGFFYSIPTIAEEGILSETVYQ